MLVREGANYRVILDGGVATASVWRRADVTSQEGADAAKELATSMIVLAREASALSAIVDLHDAPPVAGPQTLEHLSSLIRAWEGAAKRIALVHGVHPIHVMQVKRLARENAYRHGAAFDSIGAARAWLAQPR